MAASTRLYRVPVTVPLAHVARFRALGEHGQKALLHDLQRRVAKLGRANALAALQDPTSDARAIVIATSAPPPGANDGVVSIGHAQEVTVPFARENAKASRFDAGLSADEASAVEHALLNDTDPRHVGDGGLPNVLDPYFPASASLLRLKGKLLDAGLPVTSTRMKDLLRAVLSDEGDTVLDGAREAFERFIETSKLPIAIWRDRVRAAASRLSKDVRDALHDHTPAVRALSRSIVVPIELQVFGQNQRVGVIPPKRLVRALPPRADDSFISPSALQLTLALQKPKWSRVGEPDAVGRAMQVLQQSPPSLARDRANHQMDRAAKAIDRQRWVEWYRHHQLLDTSMI